MAKHARTGGVGAGATAWWLDTGEEDCPYCEETYSYEVEVRCVACDAAICPMCVAGIKEVVLCPDCREASEAR